MRTLEDIMQMSIGDYGCGIVAHYKPLAKIVNDNNFKVGLEIGCAYGNNAEYLLLNTDIEKLYSVDPYIFYDAMPGFICQEEYDTLYNYAKNKLKGFNCFRGILRMNSKLAFDYFIQRRIKFDFIFLDGDHSYDTVKWEIEHYYNLIKKNGILCGHDYNIFESVTTAVNEMAKSLNVGLTIHDGNIWSFEPKK